MGVGLQIRLNARPERGQETVTHVSRHPEIIYIDLLKTFLLNIFSEYFYFCFAKHSPFFLLALTSAQQDQQRCARSFDKCQ